MSNMAKIEFNIEQLYKMAFGYVGLPFPLGSFSRERLSTSLDSIVKSIIGKNDVYGKPYFMPVRLNGTWLPNSPTMSITRQKRIVSTVVAGKSGTIKELISADDFKLQIRGFAINFESNDYPYDDVQKIKELEQINKSIEIFSDLTVMFEINNVVIESFNLPEIVGLQNVQPYEFSLVSDDDFDVIVK
jgi:hypothetical protein